MKELTPYILDLNLALAFPGPFVYNFWQPWVRDFNGERTVGYIINYNAGRWIWYDQDMKESMIGRR